ncbi:MAG TPA: cation-transporting P-type ATPase [Actinomycetales bacterium]|nr:cation-transporting P-type ATPase [Actinomycetales bacterium]
MSVTTDQAVDPSGDDAARTARLAADMTADATAGLSSDEARRRHARYGPNVLPRATGPSAARLLAGQLVHFFAVMLWVASGLALVAGMPALAVAIAVVVVLNGVFSFAQEYRADRAAQRLRDLMPTTVTVRRDGRTARLPADQLVPGDVVLLEAGDRVSADLVLLPGADLGIDESSMTGESVPAARGAGDTARAGTFVVRGRGYGEVVATGAGTAIAAIAVETQRASRPTSPLAQQLHRVVTTVAVAAVAVGIGFFGVSLLLGRAGTESFLFGVGVMVALVPESLLPTVTLSLARAAQRMAGRHALVRRLESVETLGATTFLCTDKTGTLTRNEMAVVEFRSPAGTVTVAGEGYAPSATLSGTAAAVAALERAADSARRCVPDSHALHKGDRWVAVGDPMEVALAVLGVRLHLGDAGPTASVSPFDAVRKRSSVVDGSGRHVIGAPDSVVPLCVAGTAGADDDVAAMADRGLRVLAVAIGSATGGEHDLELLGLVGLEDPPRTDVSDAVRRCHDAGIRIAMVTGDHPRTARAIGLEVGLIASDGLVLTSAELPADDAALGELLDRDGVVVARVTPDDKLRIARTLQQRGHVVAMTGDGVNDGPALRAADIGVAMGASGTDVAREAADVVLLDDHLATIVAAIELGRATFTNIRRFLTYHLTDNVAELAPFVVWALSGGQVPLALTVLQVLALDIGTDLLPALALGAEPANPHTMEGRRRQRGLIDGPLLRRAFGVLGPAEAVWSLGAFLTVLLVDGWRLGQTPSASLLATASGTAFAAIVLGQLANAFACRSESRWVGRTGLRGNPLLLLAVGVELVTLLSLLGVPPVADLLGGGWPSPLGWLLASGAVVVVVAVDALHKAVRSSRRPRGTA